MTSNEERIAALERRVAELERGPRELPRLGPRSPDEAAVKAQTDRFVDAVKKSIDELKEPKTCTTSGDPVAKVRAEQTNETGQYKSYVVLCEEERAKGFVRPYRDRYQHVGRLVDDDGAGSTRRVGGCGTVTTMGRSLSETYARDPKFYGATFCCGCDKHLPVGEFTWPADGEEVGS